MLTVTGNVLRTVLPNGGPTEDDGFISFTDAMRAGSRHRARGPSLLVRQIDHRDNAALLGLSTILSALAVICLALTALFLYRATYARSSQVGRLPFYMSLAGLALLPLGSTLRDFASGSAPPGSRRRRPHRRSGARPARLPAVAAAASRVRRHVRARRRRRARLAERHARGPAHPFFGVLGILAGVLTIFQYDQPGIVRAFWLIGVGLLIAGRRTRRRRGRPAAPSRGRASSRSASSGTRPTATAPSASPARTTTRRPRPSSARSPSTRARSASAAAEYSVTTHLDASYPALRG